MATETTSSGGATVPGQRDHGAQAGGTRPPVRERAKPESAAYELFVAAVTAFSLLMLAVYYLLPLNPPTRETLRVLDVMVCVVFAADSIRSLRRAPDRRAYLKWGWLDFVGSIPMFLPLRLLRLRRLVSAVRSLHRRRLRQLGEDLERDRAQGAALLMVLLVIVVLTSSTVAVLEFETDVQQGNIRSGADAFWWSVVTMATVGYGDYYPVSAWGRIAAVALMTVGVGIFGVLASYLANFFLPTTDGADGSEDLAAIRADLARLDERLEAIEAALRDLAPPGPGDDA